ncbi:MAG: DNA-binding response regulator [Ignavibacteriae bacterium HGW-Ignavibacteriae-4]|jgi:DNA-binding NarL/FixJ family response regulator|nr:MAG: DNA-binding response regulator [Ignavibacteriae bacterium HGW-Ignavibacteriae-4]
MIEPTESNPIRLILADDHEIVRAGIRRLLSIDKRIKIVDEADNGLDLLDIVSYHKPDVVISDIMMPKLNGIEALKKIRDMKIDCFVIMLTAYEDSFHLENALEAGADGYLSKDLNAKELVDSIFEVIKGERVFSKSVVRLIKRKSASSSELESTPVVITRREQEILDLVANGKTSQYIAEKLFISVRTVESHRYNLMQKLDVSNVAELIRYSILKRTSE